MLKRPPRSRMPRNLPKSIIIKLGTLAQITMPMLGITTATIVGADASLETALSNLEMDRLKKWRTSNKVISSLRLPALQR